MPGLVNNLFPDESVQASLLSLPSHVVAGFSPRSVRWKLTRAKARDHMTDRDADSNS